jgi:Flp pilus assembly protein TadD
MAEERLHLPGHLALKAAILALMLLASACSVPRIVILPDPLSAREHNDLGLAYEQKGLLDLAEKEYLKASEKQKDWAVPPFNLGNLLYKKGDLKRAEEYYRTALTHDANNPDILNNLANLLFEKGLSEEARQMIEHALSIQQKEEYLDTYRRIMGKEPGVP